MALFPFSIADIDDPEHIRLVLYASGRMGHAPLNALLKNMQQEMQQEMRREDKRNTQVTAQLLQRVCALEEQLTTILQDNENRGTKSKA
ncbi:hypothetical protein [Bartonella schoenbuchensis]|uniref:Uncharacterized protein n=2 Tax=Bartonella schoenbuchensis TaxID=165694 RepID=E6Z1A0_BARSR|nr:hypothetical protein [Bartonella schoenbuchensis]AQX31294.1 hypothetical protein BscR1v2_013860 [Bartonella schoenbuchensis R1]CBI82888.1 conserved hypothetical protein [Bartonella schoenbuchensis R1]CDP80602.1 hypothetical DNA-binding protein [Bartonella schoenbuchensis]